MIEAVRSHYMRSWTDLWNNQLDNSAGYQAAVPDHGAILSTRAHIVRTKELHLYLNRGTPIFPESDTAHFVASSPVPDFLRSAGYCEKSHRLPQLFLGESQQFTIAYLGKVTALEIHHHF